MIKTQLMKMAAVSVLGLSGVFAFSTTHSSYEAHAGSETRLYLDMSDFQGWTSDAATFKVHTWNSANGDKYFPATKVGNFYYYADVDLGTYSINGGYRFTRFASDGVNEWNRGKWNDYNSGINTYYRPTGWAEAGIWDKAEQETWTLVGSTSGVLDPSSEDVNYPLTMRFNDEGLQFYSTEVSLEADTVFQIRKSDATSYGFDALETNTLGSTYISGSAGSNITITKSGVFEIYMKPFQEKFWFQVNSETEATEFATTFLDTTSPICSTGSSGSDHSAGLMVIWDDLSSAWDELTIGAKNVFNGGTINATIADAHARYIHIMNRYSNTLTPFDGGPTLSSRFSNPLLQSHPELMVVVIISSLAVISISIFFLLKKKKRNE